MLHQEQKRLPKHLFQERQVQSGNVNGHDRRWKVKARVTVDPEIQTSSYQWHRGQQTLALNLRDNNYVYEVEHGGLTECSMLLIMNGHRFVLSLFSTGCTTFSTTGRSFRLGWQQVLGPTWRRRVSARVKSSWDGAGQLGFRFTHVLFLHMLGQASPVFASIATLLFGSIWVHGGRVGLWGHTCPLEVTRVTLIAGWPWGHGPGRPNRTLGKQNVSQWKEDISGKCVPGNKSAVYRNTDELEWSVTDRLLPPVLWRTLGRCWTFSWVRGDTGECWWLYDWEGVLTPLLLLLPKLCSVPKGKFHSMLLIPRFWGEMCILFQHYKIQLDDWILVCVNCWEY